MFLGGGGTGNKTPGKGGITKNERRTQVIKRGRYLHWGKQKGHK